MPREFTCPGCMKPFTVEESAASSFACPSCGTQVSNPQLMEGRPFPRPATGEPDDMPRWTARPGRSMSIGTQVVIALGVIMGVCCLVSAAGGIVIAAVCSSFK